MKKKFIAKFFGKCLKKLIEKGRFTYRKIDSNYAKIVPEEDPEKM